MSKKIHFRNTVNCQKFVVWFVLVRGARSFSAGVSDWLIWIWRSSFELNRNYCATMLQKSNSINSSIFKIVFCYIGMQEIEYLNHTTELYVKKWTSAWNYSKGAHHFPRRSSNQDVTYSQVGQNCGGNMYMLSFIWTPLLRQFYHNAATISKMMPYGNWGSRITLICLKYLH